MNQFPDRRQTLFGRAKELSLLKHLSGKSGVTFISGNPQIGKSTLLIEAIRQLSEPSELFLVGYTRCFGGDAFLRVVADLYARWLSDSTYLQQAKVVLDQQKEDFFGRFGEGVGTIFEKLSKLGGKPLEVMGSMALEGLKKLAEANRDLTTGRITFDSLPQDKARDLLSLVHRVSGRPLVLVVDAWEKSQDVENDALILENFIQDISEWPPCHIFVVHVPEDKTKSKEKFLLTRYPASVQHISLNLMDLAELKEKESLLSYVRLIIPFTAKIADEQLLGVIDGYPEVINRWAKLRPTTLETLLEQADAAHRSRFSELADFKSYPKNVRHFLMKFALVAGSDDPIIWRQLSPIFMKEVEPSDIDWLKQKGILEEVSPPSLGHNRRVEATLYTFSTSDRVDFKRVCEDLIFDLAEKVRETSIELHSHIQALAILVSTTSSLNLKPGNAVLCECALSLRAKVSLNPAEVDSFVNEYLAGHPQAGPLLAMSLVNMLNIEMETEEKRNWRDALSDQLVHVAGMIPDDPRIAEELAKGLLNLLHARKLERNSSDSSTIVEDLTRLADHWPDHVGIHVQVAKMYSGMLPDFDDEMADLQSLHALNSLKELKTDFGSQPDVMMWVLRGFLQAAAQCLRLGETENAEVFIRDVFGYLAMFENDASFLRDSSALVYQALYHATVRDANLLAVEILLPILSSLNAFIRENVEIRHNFAKSLHVGIVCASKYEWKLSWNSNQRALDALRVLARDNKADPVMKDELVAGLACVILEAIKVDNLKIVDDLFAELETLFDGAVAKTKMLDEYCRTLLNLVSYRDSKDDVQKRDAVLDQLFSLTEKYPGRREIQRRLSKALFVVTVNAAGAGELEKSHALSTQHRRLVDECEGDSEIRGHFVESLKFRRKNLSEPEASRLLGELFQLMEDYPEQGAVLIDL